jgi:tRNA(Ile)-lysidine synthase
MYDAPMQGVTWPPPGRYILAVSGGADSMVLLDLFTRAATKRGYELVVAHFDHGLRPDSAADRAVAAARADHHDLPFVYHEARLADRPGQRSEAAARAARYAWLEALRRRHQAAAVITAHHADDLLETSLLNLARGTGRRGLAPMQAGGPTSTTVLRPLLSLTRADLRAYAATHHLNWHEDPTNADLANPRNFVRHRLLPHATPAWRQRYLALTSRLVRLNSQIDRQLTYLLHRHRLDDTTYSFPRDLIRDLSPAELEELFTAGAYHLMPGIQLDRRLIQEMVMFAKTAAPHRRRPLRQGLNLIVERDTTLLKIANPPQNQSDIVY